MATRATRALATALLAGALWAIPLPAAAQSSAEKKTWAFNASAGFALTTGNTDTRTFNAAYDLIYDPKTRNIVKSDGLIIRGTTQGEASADRLGINFRDEYRIHDGAFVFGQNQYLRDSFKSIDYLIAPTTGLGYKPFDSDRTKVEFDAGIGAVWEKNAGADVRASGAVTLGESLNSKLTSTTSLTHSFSGLWKTDDFGDALYVTRAGIATVVSARTQLKLEVVDTFKNRTPAPTVLNNDLAFLMAFVYKF